MKTPINKNNLCEIDASSYYIFSGIDSAPESPSKSQTEDDSLNPHISMKTYNSPRGNGPLVDLTSTAHGTPSNEQNSNSNSIESYLNGYLELSKRFKPEHACTCGFTVGCKIDSFCTKKHGPNYRCLLSCCGLHCTIVE